MTKNEVAAAQELARRRFAEAGIVIGSDADIEIADFGLDHWMVEGLGLLVRINESEYCSKFMTLEPGQVCPLHYHKMKKETFFTLAGDVELWADGEIIALAPGQSHTIKPGVLHSFKSHGGAVIEEVSTHDENSDSYFQNPKIVRDTRIENTASMT